MSSLNRFVVTIIIMLFTMLYASAIPSETPMFSKRHGHCANDRQQLFSLLNEVKRENVQLKQARTNWRKNMFSAASRIRALEKTVRTLEITNTHWAQKINEMKRQLNEEKAERIRNAVLRRQHEEIGLW